MNRFENGHFKSGDLFCFGDVSTNIMMIRIIKSVYIRGDEVYYKYISLSENPTIKSFEFRASKAMIKRYYKKSKIYSTYIPTAKNVKIEIL